MTYVPCVQPHRVSLEFCVVAHDEGHARLMLESMIEQAEIGGVFLQQGSVTPMDAADVVEGSPLAAALCS